MRSPVILSYAAFVLIGVGAGANGVLLLAQMQDYGVDRTTIGITFFTWSAGFVLAGLSAGALIDRFGARVALAAGGASVAVAGCYLGTRPPFALFVLVQLLAGYGNGVLESALNVHLAALPGATTLLNRLHAFFGVGALIGPVLAAWLVSFTSWTVVCLILAAAGVPLTAGFLVAFPGRQTLVQPAAGPSDPPASGLLRTALRDRGVLSGAAMLAVYVGLELSVGNWAFSYLVQARALSGSLAGYSVGGFWLGLTLGRFLISPIVTRLGASTVSMMYACLAGITAVTVLAWLSPAGPLVSVALLLLGFFLGPVFPTTMAMVPRLTRARLIPTAIGVMNAAATVGGSGLPWLAGTIAQATGMWVLMPIAVMLAVLQFGVWWPLARISRDVHEDRT